MVGDVLEPVVEPPPNLTLPPAFESRDYRHRTLRGELRKRAFAHAAGVAVRSQKIHTDRKAGAQGLKGIVQGRRDRETERDFARRASTEAFGRAVGLAQHRTMDVFHKLPQLLPLEDIATLDELGTVVFGV